MSLLQYSFKQQLSSSSTSQVEELSVPSHMLQLHESGLSSEEQRNFALAVSDLVDPQVISNKRQKEGEHSVYTDEDWAKMANYAFENGNKSAHKSFFKQFPNLLMKVLYKLLRSCTY